MENAFTTVQMFATAVRNAFEECQALSGEELCSERFEFWLTSDPSVPTEQADWYLRGYPSISHVDGVYSFHGYLLRMHVRTAATVGYNDGEDLDDVSRLSAVLDRMMKFRDHALTLCKHTNFTHVKNCGYLCDRYLCQDCGENFLVDTLDM